MKDETLLLIAVGLGAYLLFFSGSGPVVGAPPVGAYGPGPDNSNLGVPPLGEPSGPFDKPPKIRDHRRPRDPSAGQGTGGSSTNTTPNLPGSIPALANDVRKVAVGAAPPNRTSRQSGDEGPYGVGGMGHPAIGGTSFPPVVTIPPAPNPLLGFIRKATAPSAPPSSPPSSPPKVAVKTSQPKPGKGIPSFKRGDQ